MKRICAILSAVVLVICFGGCSTKENKKIDVDALTKKVLSDVKFESELNEINDTVLSVTYVMPDGVTGKAYLGSSTAADQLAVFTADSAGSAAKTKEMLEKKVKSLHDTFAAYDVPELTKIDNAVIKVHGNYVVFCITDDYENAAKVIASQLK